MGSDPEFEALVSDVRRLGVNSGLPSLDVLGCEMWL